ncbi:MAG: ATPase [Acidimicrobiales bacterium]|nr:ATPase [Acidimicrobiales bacterium]
MGASPLVVRVAFGVATLAAGSGLIAYLLAWLLLAGRDDPEPRPVTLRHNLGVVAATAMELAFVQGLTDGVQGNLLWPAASVGFALALAEPDPAARTQRGSDDTARPGARGRQGDLGRVGAGLVLMLAGFLSALAGSQNLSSLLRVLPAALVLVGGLGLVVAPWLRGVLADAAADRRERARAEARSDMAAHLHDSVLQTLTLIQNRAGQPEVAAALAHQQERELRRWLYGVDRDAVVSGASLRSSLEAVAAEVEDQYLKIIECIVVGDTAVTAELGALVAAAREAMVNAAKFAEISMISVYVEVAAGADGAPQVLLFVRDRGVGFDPGAVPADRYGISDSIQARVQRVGGSATVRSMVGHGTEVAMAWPR